MLTVGQRSEGLLRVCYYFLVVRALRTHVAGWSLALVPQSMLSPGSCFEETWKASAHNEKTVMMELLAAG
jgi:hypothetical protein